MKGYCVLLAKVSTIYKHAPTTEEEAHLKLKAECAKLEEAGWVFSPYHQGYRHPDHHFTVTLTIKGD